MKRIAPGQVWQNGRTAVQIQSNQDKLELVTFDLKDGALRFRKSAVCDERKAETYLKRLNCKYTTKVLTAVNQ